MGTTNENTSSVNATATAPAKPASKTAPLDEKTQLKIKKRWLIYASCVLLVLTLTYTLLHAFFYDTMGVKSMQLEASQITVINSIVRSGENAAEDPAGIASETAAVTDSMPKDSLDTNAVVAPPTSGLISTASTSKIEERVVNYICGVLNVRDTNTVTQLVHEQGIEDLTYLSYYPFQVKSYFWLSEYWVLLEVIFWSLFGLIANLMHSVTSANPVDPKQFPEHVGKFFYTPFTAVVIFLSLSMLTGSNSINESPTGTYVLVFAFILGFFTRRTILLLKKIKTLIFPNDEEDSDRPKKGRKTSDSNTEEPANTDSNNSDDTDASDGTDTTNDTGSRETDETAPEAAPTDASPDDTAADGAAPSDTPPTDSNDATPGEDATTQPPTK